MKFRKLSLCCFAASLCLMLAAFMLVSEQQKNLSGKVIRFHVLAASDSEEDQRRKLLVRDALLNVLSQESFQSREEAEAWVTSHLDTLTEEANRTLLSAGDDHTARVTLTRETYPTREYPTFSLPAGEYLSLRAVIGEGAGHNWWCVVYPAMCMASSQDAMQAQAVSAGFTPDEITLLTGQTAPIRVRFRLLELLSALRARFR